MQAGLNVTINTDDPSVSRIDLSHEYKLICEDLGIPLNVLKRSILSAGQAAFLPEDERNELVSQLEKKLNLKLVE